MTECSGTLGTRWGLFHPFLFGKQFRGNFCLALGSPSPPPPRPLQMPLINLKQT